jgi:hypothetical protein
MQLGNMDKEKFKRQILLKFCDREINEQAKLRS